MKVSRWVIILGCAAALGLTGCRSAVHVAGPSASARPPATTRCRTSQLAAAFTDETSGILHKELTLVLTNRSAHTCYVNGFAGLGFLDSSGHLLSTHLAHVNYPPHAAVTLHPGGSARALLDWTAIKTRLVPYLHPSVVDVTPPGQHTHLAAKAWTFGPIAGGILATSPFR